MCCHLDSLKPLFLWERVRNKVERYYIAYATTCSTLHYVGINQTSGKRIHRIVNAFHVLVYRVILHEQEMENDISFSPHQANSQTPATGLIPCTPPTCETYADGQSVENVLSPATPQSESSLQPVLRSDSPSVSSHWYVIRATRGRAQEVYDEIMALDSPLLEAYIPRYHVEKLKITNGHPEKVVDEGILHNGLLFVRTTRQEFTKLVRGLPPYPFIKGLTPYYDHFREIEAGRNDYLVVPDKQFQDFRTILQSEDVNILIDQEQMPTYLNGKKVVVTSGPFAGVNGTLLRWKGVRRVFIQIDQLGTYGTGFVRSADFKIIEE